MSILELGNRLIQWSAPLEIFWVSAWSNATLNAGTSDVRTCVFLEGDQYCVETNERNGGAVFVMSSADPLDIERYLVHEFGPRVRSVHLSDARPAVTSPRTTTAGPALADGFVVTRSTSNPPRCTLIRGETAGGHVITFAARYEAESFSHYAATSVDAMKASYLRE